jgi:hypothetical protein
LATQIIHFTAEGHDVSLPNSLAFSSLRAYQAALKIKMVAIISPHANQNDDPHQDTRPYFLSWTRIDSMKNID